MPNAWVTHVKQYAAANKTTYGCALSMPECKAAYKKEPTKVPKTKESKKEDTKVYSRESAKKYYDQHIKTNPEKYNKFLDKCKKANKTYYHKVETNNIV